MILCGSGAAGVGAADVEAAIDAWDPGAAGQQNAIAKVLLSCHDYTLKMNVLSECFRKGALL